jgi:lipid A 3-O-deacylase
MASGTSMLALIWLIAAAAVCAAACPAVEAPAAPEPTPAGSLIFHFENDVLGTDDSDRNYTNGLQLSWQTAENRVWPWLDRWVRRHLFAGPGAALRAHLAVGQNLYTPEDLSRTDLITDDRPYAAWLHADLGLVAQDASRLRSVLVSVGVVGPAAGGEAVQKWVHRVIESPDPQGWANQIGNELAVMAIAEHKWRHVRPLFGSGLQWDLSPHGNVAVGNVFTYAGVGGTVRLGQGLERDFGPPRIHPSPPGSGYFAPSGRFGWSVFAGCDGRFVLQDIFLDGNTFRDSHRVDKEAWVGEILGGFTVSARGIRLGAVYVHRSREFTLQDRGHHFGSLTVSMRL